MTIPLKIQLLLITSLLLSACNLKEKLDTPRENDLVVWKQNPQLIVKAKLGPRREHIPDQFDYEFYRPAREHYLGQFPIDYAPEKFPSITQQEADLLPMPDSNRQLQFDLKLRDSYFQATDGYLPDHDDQVRVRIEGLTMDMISMGMTSKKALIEIIDNPKFIKLGSKFEKYGLECYIRNISDQFYFYYGESKAKNVTGVFFHISTSKDSRVVAISGNSYEPHIYGGVWVKWETNLNNWDKWQEIDSAIWRLLETWNAAPLNHNQTKQKRDSLS